MKGLVTNAMTLSLQLLLSAHTSHLRLNLEIYSCKILFIETNVTMILLCRQFEDERSAVQKSQTKSMNFMQHQILPCMLCSNCVEFHLRIHREKLNNCNYSEFRLSIYLIRQAEDISENTQSETKISYSSANTENMPPLMQNIRENILNYLANNHHMYHYLIFNFIPLCKILGLVITQTFTFSKSFFL